MTDDELITELRNRIERTKTQESKPTDAWFSPTPKWVYFQGYRDALGELIEVIQESTMPKKSPAEIEQESTMPKKSPAEIEASAREFLEATESLCDWMNDNDLSADHAAQQPADFVRFCAAMERLQEALGEE